MTPPVVNLPIAQPHQSGDYHERVSASAALRRQLVAKRVIDVIAGVVLLIALAPFLMMVAVAVRMTSRGNAIYAGERYGLNNRRFPCLKFRSMRQDQDAVMRRSGLAMVGEDGRPLLHARDPRITRLGHWLRLLSIDELPQIVNVIRGEMSLIGPRPLALSMLDPFPQFAAARAVMRPGITGLWQVRARRKNVGALDMQADDLEYIANYSLLLDLKILFLTVNKIILPDR
ncbi:hypothetical protein ASG67_12660 [Sphingomonas sp. Leaf339]|nr:hypothetical protein ASG67_12660 [Sphingomonas sp. Leaf339]